MIKILQRHKGLKTGGVYYVKQDGEEVYILHRTSGNGIKTTPEGLNKIKYEYLPEYEMAM